MTKEEYMGKILGAKYRAIAPVSPLAIPHSCAGCLHLMLDGKCNHYNNYPPLEFIETVNDCWRYEEDIPF